jgi:hypothetical protein
MTQLLQGEHALASQILLPAGYQRQLDVPAQMGRKAVLWDQVE